MGELQHSATVLVAEDPFIVGFLKSCLSRYGYRVIGGDSNFAMNILRSGEPRVDVLITNQPENFADSAARMPLLYIAAFPEPARASAFPRCRMLRKPFHPQQMLAALAGLLAGRAATE